MSVSSTLIASAGCARNVARHVRSGKDRELLALDRDMSPGVPQGWTGTVLKGSSVSPLDGGDFEIIKVSDRESVAKVELSVGQFQNNRDVSLTPP